MSRYPHGPGEPPPVDEFDLELQLAGAELDPELIRALEQAPHLAPVRDEIATLEGWWARHRPPLPRPGPPVWWRVGLGAGAVLALAAALLLFLQPPAPEPMFRARGATAVDLVRLQGSVPIGPSEPVQDGEQLSVSLIPDEPSYVSVATLQRDGRISLHVTSAPTGAGERFELPGRLLLDGYRDREWLVVLTLDQPLDRAEIEARLHELLPEPSLHRGPGIWTVELTRGRPPGGR
ncbi:MAG TPA: hypothetical protein ENK18_20690 [Deltaproteobacteria bacterium]|nr:hypothetical protein [Deltaproteobacteria bacterium]